MPVDVQAAEELFRVFLADKEAEIGVPLLKVRGASQRLSRGWAFYYQSKAYTETGDMLDSLIGHGPVVIRDDGKIIEGGSLDWDPETLLAR
jgi:hypothetical protein